MHLSLSLSLSLPTFLTLITLAHSQAAVPAAVPAAGAGVGAGGGIVATSLAASQYPTTTVAGSLFTSGGTTSATWVPYTMSFATTALGSWDLPASPQVGSIGLGSIEGTVGATKAATKR